VPGKAGGVFLSSVPASVEAGCKGNKIFATGKKKFASFFLAFPFLFRLRLKRGAKVTSFLLFPSPQQKKLLPLPVVFLV